MTITIRSYTFEVRLGSHLFCAAPGLGEAFIELRKPSPDVPRLVSFDRAR